MASLLSRRPPRGLEAALGEGAFDKPGIARDFRRFLGCTAGEWARQRLGVVGHAPRPYKAERPHAG